MVPMERVQENSAPVWKEEDRKLSARNRTWQQRDAEHSTEVLCKGKDPDCWPGE